jgi:vacuolar protein-sorting-associated protein 4
VPRKATTLKQVKSGEADAPEKKEEEKPKKKSNLDSEIVRQIEDSILDQSPNVHWNDIQGLEDVKKVLKETIVLP